MMIPGEIIDSIREHAESVLPNECCGVIVQDSYGVKYIACTNTSTDVNDFAISAEEYADIEDQYKISMIVHSHPNRSCEPSMADKVSCEESSLPWLIMSVPSGEYSIYEPCGYEAPYLERPFVMGVLDCYSIIRDWYARERLITLPNPKREMDFWKDPANNLYVDNFAANGFYQLSSGSTPQPGDVFLMQIRSKIPNHGALYIGDGKILQHCLGQLSQRYMYGGTWQFLTTHHLRHA